VLGGGSNLLIADRGLDALVLRINLRGVTSIIEGDTVRVSVGAGERWDDIVALAVERGWAGLECLSGIPGDTGAAPIQNIGAYGQEVAETIALVRAIDRATGTAVTLDNAACGFGYRDSVFKHDAKDRYAIVGVTFALRLGGAATVRYAELERRLREIGALASPALAPPLAVVRDTVLALRRGKSMLLDPADENGKSAGSFFMNPTVSADDLDLVKARVEQAGALGSGESMPVFPAADGRVKLSAAWLIERAGYRKGTSMGAVGLSTRHALAIVNRGGATAAEILAFATRVRNAVLDRFGVALVPEPALLGFAPDELGDFSSSLGRL
jgi:UDP-N-acetylmuramate dehydrogenase